MLLGFAKTTATMKEIESEIYCHHSLLQPKRQQHYNMQMYLNYLSNENASLGITAHEIFRKESPFFYTCTKAAFLGNFQCNINMN